MPLTEIQQQIADLLATKLRDGLIHPGDPDRDIPPTPIALPLRPMPGQPQEMTELMDKTVELLGEALVNTIDVDGDVELIPRAQAKSMRMAAGEEMPMHVVPVHCQCDVAHRDPLATLTFSDPDRIVVNGPALLRGLHARNIKCPHERVG